MLIYKQLKIHPFTAEKNFSLSEVVLNSLRSHARKKRVFSEFRTWAALCGATKPVHLFFCSHSWENSIIRLRLQIVGASHRTTNNGLSHFSFFLRFTSIFILLPLSIFTLSSLFFVYNLFHIFKILKNIQNFKRSNYTKCSEFQNFASILKIFET